MKFTKMQAFGNDYVYIDAIHQELKNLPELARFVSDRHFAIGSDGMVLICPSDKGDFRMRMFNPDGTEGEMCGNALRSVGKYVYDHRLTDKTELVIETLGGMQHLTLTVTDGYVSNIRADIGEPRLSTKVIPINTEMDTFVDQPVQVLDRKMCIRDRRCVAIVAGVVSIIVSAILLFIWPLLFGALVAIGESIVGLGPVGAGIYAFLNRLLIPTGLHHALNNVFWFDTIGLGDLQHFWAGETSADVSWDLGMYMSGFFPCMMFGVPGAALAMVHTAKSDKKKLAIGLVASAALCAFVCGVTEPFEFGFMFLAPALYVVYAALYGIFTVITVLVGFRAGFSFSAGATDLIFSAPLPAAKNTWMIIPLGIAAFIVFYVVFRFAITKFDLKTPGREDDDVEAEKKVDLGSSDYTTVAATILEGVGGAANVTSIDNCITRLRLEVKDSSLVDEKKIKSAGAAGVIRPSKTAVQVVVGTKVQFVADEFKKLCK